MLRSLLLVDRKAGDCGLFLVFERGGLSMLGTNSFDSAPCTSKSALREPASVARSYCFTGDSRPSSHNLLFTARRFYHADGTERGF